MLDGYIVFAEKKSSRMQVALFGRPAAGTPMAVSGVRRVGKRSERRKMHVPLLSPSLSRLDYDVLPPLCASILDPLTYRKRACLLLVEQSD